MIYAHKISTSVLIAVSYMLILRPIRVWFGDQIDVVIYPPFGMWYVGALLVILIVDRFKTNHLKSFIVILTSIEIILFLVFWVIQYYFQSFFDVNTMAFAHMILSCAVVLTSLQKEPVDRHEGG